MACAEICPKSAISIVDSLKHQNAVIDETKCVGCGLCGKVCQIINPPALHNQILWTQGWNRDPDLRRKSSSGGFAYSLALQVISEGGCVASCLFKDSQFKYAIADTAEELDLFRGSKYVKSNPSGIYRSVKQRLIQGHSVLFIGLPCHVAALKNYLGKDYENLITVDLICHGSPTPQLLEKFLNQYDLCLGQLEKIHFRTGNNFRISAETTPNAGKYQEISFTQAGIKDRYTIGFLYGLIYTENCYHCRFARDERVSDITIGDSWGSELNETEKDKGISLALCQTEKGKRLLDRCSVDLFEVDPVKARAANRQLRGPSPMPEGREIFFSAIERGVSFNSAVTKAFPKLCLRHDVKAFLLKTGIIKNNIQG